MGFELYDEANADGGDLVVVFPEQGEPTTARLVKTPPPAKVISLEDARRRLRG